MTESTIRSNYTTGLSEREAYIRFRIEDQINYYEKKSQYNKKIYYIISMATIIANAMIPIISIFLPTSTGPKLIITGISAFNAILTGALTMFGAKELWGKYRQNASRITALLHQYYAHSGIFADKGEDEAFKLLVNLCEAKMEEENNGWENIIGRQQSIPATPKLDEDK